jgi:hypothetical protein
MSYGLFPEMTLEELAVEFEFNRRHAASDFKAPEERSRFGGIAKALSVALSRRRIVRDAILDMAEEMDEAGLAVVPKIATAAMIDAVIGGEHLDWSLEPGEGLDGVNYDDIWADMLDAAPTVEADA